MRKRKTYPISGWDNDFFHNKEVQS